ncbi:HD domain-containing protein [Candidatus Woesearchaeota archaeon]|nr:HD domain-containing protein [Candidatus Woesearchaeota archaeon]MBT4835021.1 HD domain-containing protein [Candidatus Woesearchaeota archaeon]MBT6735360.1 HD domain-containing protein [Candidatus Woesearchaeota archaeon]MBT7169694.1 HD domain-containing protein [Candidatus Woesearchaeota archaeon]MBT7474805.1 HD domain-containing protein [Candidatus Woesearchaeota archaeon]
MEILRKMVLPYFDEGDGHGFDHVERVYNLALKISESENVDVDIVKSAALLHDICRKQGGETGQCHAIEGAKLTPEILRKINFPEDKIENVVHCVKVHRYSNGFVPETKEAKILQDADRLDAIGAIAITRIITHGIKHNMPIYNPKIKPSEGYSSKSETSINHFYEKILKLKPETFHTKSAQKIAKERYLFTQKFVNQIIDEWDGKK